MNPAVQYRMLRLTRKLREWEGRLDKATNLREIGEALAMKRLYEDAIIALDDID